MWVPLIMAAGSALGGMLQGQGAAAGYGDEQQALQEAIARMGQAGKTGVEGLLPFQKAGASAIPQLQGELGLLQDPLKARQFLMRGFQESPEAKLAEEQGEQASQRAAAAGGTSGTGAQQAQLQMLGQKISMADQSNFLKQQQGLFTEGLQGLQGQEGIGLQAGGSIANLLAEISKAQAQAEGAFGAAQAKGAQASAGGLGSLIGGATSGLGALSKLF